VKDAGDEKWGGEEEGEVFFVEVEVFRGCGAAGPEKRVIVWQEGEEEAEEEGGCCVLGG
jgi:hypothetical protein